jgi:arsenate reductase (thioredoxin)
MPVPRPTRVLFVCIGNAYRSQMAQAFARTLGHDLLVAESAGLTPVFVLPESTVQVMREKGIDISAQFPKPVVSLDLKGYELIVNMTGLSIPSLSSTNTRSWIVPDPVGQPDSVLREVRDEIESLVMGLVLELRRPREETARPRLNPKLRGV